MEDDLCEGFLDVGPAIEDHVDYTRLLPVFNIIVAVLDAPAAQHSQCLLPVAPIAQVSHQWQLPSLTCCAALFSKGPVFLGHFIEPVLDPLVRKQLHKDVGSSKNPEVLNQNLWQVVNFGYFVVEGAALEVSILGHVVQYARQHHKVLAVALNHGVFV